jgi:hypothetical protein
VEVEPLAEVDDESSEPALDWVVVVVVVVGSAVAVGVVAAKSPASPAVVAAALIATPTVTRRMVAIPRVRAEIGSGEAGMTRLSRWRLCVGCDATGSRV